MWYSVECGDCDGVYIGETGRRFETRLKEHIKDKSNSNVGKHLHMTGHKLNVEKCAIICNLKRARCCLLGSSLK